ncbi:hypothetical protein QMK19_22965 [Streptomyces sp. H10-C2]|uniref:hypothetical protein n=1 Tax=unclassified Streptomyces TaxID=2593676 RepID=UPI0024BB06BF|nr:MULTISPECIES: hypothetical protein [unclassified Streptomyces]MDJ0342767.1 hypothetical protein [Streptomyces sp. PH10-H1]MDJ0372445.1 hypothetical protein [Streptomyces sp. H10-C2]
MTRTGRDGLGDYQPGLHPAGFDAALHTAVQEVQTGRWMSMRDLLAATGANWALRTARSQVLASAAVRSHAVREWIKEEPRSVDASMMRARVGTEAVLRAQRAGKDARVIEGAALQARDAALAAARAYPQDPVPWVCLLAQAHVDLRQARAENRRPAPDPMLAPGPWDAMRQACERDPFNREAHHRMLTFLLHARSGGAGEGVNFAYWVRQRVHINDHTPLSVLPLYAYAEYFERHRSQRTRSIGHLQWSTEPAITDTERALHWFHKCDQTYASPLDLNHLAHALWAGCRYAEGGEVFKALGPHMTPKPWTLVALRTHEPLDALEEFRKARQTCLSYADSAQQARAGPPPQHP